MVSFFKKLKKKTARLVKESKDAIVNEIRKEKIKRLKLRESKREKFKLVSGLTNAELLKVTKTFISTSPRFVFRDAQGREKSRKPTRDEMVDAILMRVNTSSIKKLLKLNVTFKRKSSPKKKVVKKSVTKKKATVKRKKKSNDLFSLTI